MTFDNYSIGRRIKHFRNLNNLSQEDLAELISTSREHVARIESGTKIPSLELLVSIANALHISSDDLLSDNLDVLYTRSENEYYELFSDCSSDERSILLKTLKFLKAVLSEFGI